MATPRTSSAVVAGGPPPLTIGRLAAMAWHAAALLVLSYALRRLPVHAKISGFDVELQYGSHYQFLTVLGLWVSRLATIFAISADVTPTSRFLPRVKMLLSAVAMPAEVIISLLYWSIMLIDPALLIPPRQVADPNNPAQLIMETVRLPLFDDLCFHAAPAIFLLVDYMLFSPPFPGDMHPALLSALSTGAYGAWAEVCHVKNGNYPYPLLKVLNNVQRWALFSACAVIFVAITLSTTAAHKALDAAFGREWDTLDGAQGKGSVGAKDAASMTTDSSSSVASKRAPASRKNK